MAEEIERDIDSATNMAHDDFLAGQGNDQDDEHESEEIVDEIVNAPTPRRRTRSHGKTRTFIIPDAASPAGD